MQESSSQQPLLSLVQQRDTQIAIQAKWLASRPGLLQTRQRRGWLQNIEIHVLEESERVL